jgi:AraC family transcriptional regulator
MNVKADTLSFYHERINKVVNYINNHLNEDLDIIKLANVGNYSTFHFHRIMRAYLGESLGAYIIRQRLESAVGLLRYSDESISNIAFKVGYENPPSFNKAFKKRYGVSPAGYKKNNQMLMKINDSRIKFYAMENLKSLKPKIKEIKSKKVIYARAFGDYNKSAGKAWDTVCDFAKRKKLFGFRTELLGISHGDPNVTEADKLRYDACIVVTKEIYPEGEIGVQEVEGGKYAIFTHIGSYRFLKNSYDYIFGKWLAESGKELRNINCFEKYLNNAENTKEDKLKTDIYIPIQ